MPLQQTQEGHEAARQAQDEERRWGEEERLKLEEKRRIIDGVTRLVQASQKNGNQKQSRVEEKRLKRLIKLIHAEDAQRKAEDIGGVKDAADEDEDEDEDEDDEDDEDDGDEDEDDEDEDDEDDDKNDDGQDDDDTSKHGDEGAAGSHVAAEEEESVVPDVNNANTRQGHRGHSKRDRNADVSSRKSSKDSQNTSVSIIKKTNKPLPFLPEEYFAAAIMEAKANVISSLSSAAAATKAVTGAASAVSAATSAAAAAASSFSIDWRAKAPITRGGLSAIIAQNLLDIEGEIDREFQRTKKAWKLPREHIVGSTGAVVITEEGEEQQ
ncbi:hypothetical protein BGZ97_008112 [Linnemannia gamsii]|uniref:Uncharacterized protein n=1 Tax=Linnemannia gamsii TaxID=64522 RepID=A0A9P6QPF1_9FUNG|nr:hypothetical protein BGZ97_008112 [Linnemannia gamsii]